LLGRMDVTHTTKKQWWCVTLDSNGMKPLTPVSTLAH